MFQSRFFVPQEDTMPPIDHEPVLHPCISMGRKYDECGNSSQKNKCIMGISISKTSKGALLANQQPSCQGSSTMQECMTMQPTAYERKAKNGQGVTVSFQHNVCQARSLYLW